MSSENPIIKTERPYFRRHPVAKFFKIGNILVAGIQRTLWGFMSFHNGNDKLPTFAAYVGQAPVDNMGNLRVEALPEGTIIVEPGLMYQKIPPLDVTGKMMQEHQKAMIKWKPKQLYGVEKDDAPAVDLGVVNLPGTEKMQ